MFQSQNNDEFELFLSNFQRLLNDVNKCKSSLFAITGDLNVNKKSNKQQIRNYRPVDARVYSYVIRMSLVCTRVSSVCHSFVLVCHPYVTRMSSVCHSYVCHSYVIRMYSYVICMSPVCTRIYQYVKCV